jgi:hypothetical protein
MGFGLVTASADASDPDARSWQVSAAGGIFFPTQVSAHLKVDTDPVVSFHADATLPGPLLDYGIYLRQVMLRSSESGGTASLFTTGIEGKYELRLGRGCFARAGVLVGFHDLWTDTIHNAIGLDLGLTLEWAVQIVPHVRIRYSLQGTSMFVGGVPYRYDVSFRPTIATTLGVEYAFRL